MKTILVVTNSRDLTVDYLINKYDSEVQFFRLNMDRFGEYDIRISNTGSNFEIFGVNRSLNDNQVHSVYFRKPSFPDLSGYEEKFRYIMQRDMLTLVEGIAESVGEVCLSRPSVLRLADNKVVQLKLAQEVGFHMPSSVITNSAKAARQLCSETQSIVKPLSIGKLVQNNRVGFIQTNLVNESVGFNGLELAPSYFQHYMEKETELRVTIVGNEVFAVQIDSSDRIDWRKPNATNQYTSVNLPEDIIAKCFKMMELLNLSFGAFDFIVSGGKYVFLEVNANGQWLWLEEALQINISGAIMNHLTRG